MRSFYRQFLSQSRPPTRKSLPIFESCVGFHARPGPRAIRHCRRPCQSPTTAAPITRKDRSRWQSDLGRGSGAHRPLPPQDCHPQKDLGLDGARQAPMHGRDVFGRGGSGPLQTRGVGTPDLGEDDFEAPSDEGAGNRNSETAATFPGIRGFRTKIR
jgi:hypothetical protein